MVSTRLPKQSQQLHKLENQIRQQLNKIQNSHQSNKILLNKKNILAIRLKIINNVKPLAEKRLSNLEKIWKHYCTHMFRNGRNFDKIVYDNQHLNMQRFFAFINDFKINEIEENGNLDTITDRNNIVLIFKQASSNARQLEFPQFITCLERVFILIWDQTQTYEERKQKQRLQKMKRIENMRKRQLKKQRQKQKKQKQQKDNIAKQQQENKQRKEQQNIVAQKQQKKQKIQNNKQIDIRKSQLNNSNPNIQNQKELNITKKQQLGQLYRLTDQQKIQYFMQYIAIDDLKQVQKKMRYFQKANIKHHQISSHKQSQSIPLLDKKTSMIKKQFVQMHEQWGSHRKQLQQSKAQRAMKLIQQIDERQMQKSKYHLSKSLSKDQYDKKKQKAKLQFQIKQRNLMDKSALNRLTKKRQFQEEQVQQYSLHSISQSSPIQLHINKINPQRYVVPDASDIIFMQEYGYETQDIMQRHRGKPPRLISLIGSTRKRVKQIEVQQQQKLNKMNKSINNKVINKMRK